MSHYYAFTQNVCDEFVRDSRYTKLIYELINLLYLLLIYELII